MTRDIDVSDNWRTTRKQIGAHNDRQYAKIKHNNTGASIVVKEQPNGVELQLRVSADLPGGYKTVHDTEPRDIDAAVSELERYAAMYDTEGTWLIEGAPVLH